MSLLRQWELLDALWPSLLLLRPIERLVACNLGNIDDALAVTLAHFHHAPVAAGQFLMFHAGAPPARRPVHWSRAVLRGVPKRPWLEPVTGQPSRWVPHPRLMESVLLASPPGPVDLLVADAPSDLGPAATSPLNAVRQGGHLLLRKPPRTGALPAADWAVIDSAGHLYRRLTTPRPSAEPGVVGDATGMSLARHHQRAMLTATYTALARSLARRFSNRGERAEDLEQVAMLALVRAADRYDPDRGHPFGPFAATCITGELKRHFRDKTWAVRVPRSIQERYLAVRAARDDLAQAIGAPPTIAQIAQSLDTTEESVLTAMEAATNSWTTSLDAPPADAESPVVDIPVIDAGFDESLDRDLLKKSIGRLSPTERLVLKRLFFDGVTQREVAEELHVSQMQISRLKNKTIAKLRLDFQPA